MIALPKRNQRHFFSKGVIKGGSIPGNYVFFCLNQVSYLECSPYQNEKNTLEIFYFKHKKNLFPETCFIYLKEILLTGFCDNSLKWHYPVSIYLFNVNNRNTRKRCKTCSKLTIKTPERRHILPFFLVFLLLTLNKYILAAFNSKFTIIHTKK